MHVLMRLLMHLLMRLLVRLPVSALSRSAWHHPLAA